VVRIFPNRGACLRLVTALAVEQSEEWVTGRRYLDMSELEDYRVCEQEHEAEGGIGYGALEEGSHLEETTENPGLDPTRTNPNTTSVL
jgi:hypothetical protein